ncbi:response regulator transcription factor [Neptuniibacter sp. CAU 1671]|uniref:response regulator transcription factor n=1 Tax=Neptuniibacter sp. CAU 1671 TaxID=3032593 RepID=UPI0023DB8181|nr:response regulator transcription factor [Neptuniibacter sp. CAU 1671]MDF2181222.1 response regulator transcription factor [Neptuniibacter sp. CAU 1671]
MSQIRILLVDDHAIVREGYRALLNRQPNLDLVAEAGSGEQAYALYREHQPDLVVLDLSLPGKGGLATLIQIRQFDPKARVLIFSMHQNPAMATKAIEAGARGYVTKSSEPSVLIKAVTEVMQGKIALSDDMSHALALERLGGEKGLLADLTTREFEILRMLVEGKSKTEIADTLHISAKTVANCHYIIKRKLNVQSDIELLRVAMQQQLVTRTELG